MEVVIDKLNETFEWKWLEKLIIMAIIFLKTFFDLKYGNFEEGDV